MKKWVSLLAIAALTAALLAVAMPVAAAGDELLLDSCDTTEFWVANSQGQDALKLDKENKISGEGSVGGLAINGKLNHIIFQPADGTTIDISGYKYLEFDIYFSDMTWFNDCGGVMFEITSSGTCDIKSDRWMKGTLRTQFENNFIEGKENWWHIKLPLEEPQTIANGGCDRSAFNYFRFYSVDPISTTPDYEMRIDNLKVTNNEDAPVEDPTTTAGGAAGTTTAAKPTQGATTTAPAGTTTDNDATDTTTTGSEADATTTGAEENTSTTADVAGTTGTTTTKAPAGDTQDGGDEGGNTGLIVGIVVAAILVLGGGGFAVYWFAIKKKK